MKLVWLMPVAFGKFSSDEPLVLSDGLNIIMGENEAGKSTLGAFILGMLYGFKKEGVTRVYRTSEYERYRPWKGKEYRGVMVYENDGQRFRLERSFDPDVVRIYDDSTGEDLTRSFSQDTRKEYDFVAEHLGLSQKEFRNTVWVEQLGSVQEAGLGPEIQGKLESIVYGGTEDVALGKALGVLIEARNRIKSPRSTKAELDLVLRSVEDLEGEAAHAMAGEAEIREWLVEASECRKKKGLLQDELQKGEAELELARYRFLKGILAQIDDLEEQAEIYRSVVSETFWAKDFPTGLEDGFARANQEIDSASLRLSHLREELDAASEKRAALRLSLEDLESSTVAGWDEAGVASLYARFLAAKAAAAKAGRAANDARRALREIEEEGLSKGLKDAEIDQGLLKTADEYMETCRMAESQKSLLELEAEKSRAAVLSINPSSASGWLYALALGIVGMAVVLTVMGWPPSLYLFGVALAIFAAGSYRYRKIWQAKAQEQELADARVKEVQQQALVVESAQQVLSEFLSTLGVSSTSQLRILAREVEDYRVRLRHAQGNYEVAHGNWFEASQEFSVAEKELAAILYSSGCLKVGEAIADGAVDALKKKLAEIQSLERTLKLLDERDSEMEDLCNRLAANQLEAEARQKAIFDMAGVASAREFQNKARAQRAYDQASKALSETLARKSALLSGRDCREVQEEVKALLSKVDHELDHVDGSIQGFQVTEKELEEKRKQVESLRNDLGQIDSKLLVIENSISMKSSQGRSSAEIQEDLDRAREAAGDLELVRDGLDLAYCTLDELSRHVRRSFAPVLSSRVSSIISTLTGDRYIEVKVSPDLELSLVHPEGGNQVPVTSLSGGTVDQCYFALRVALAEAVLRKSSFPFFLDDSFVQYDDKRLEGALQILASLASSHQIVMFTHGREVEIAQKMGLEHTLLDIP